MRATLLLGATVIVFGFGVRDAAAMGGSGNLTPQESPYAILEPQTLGPPPVATERPPDSPPPRIRPHRMRRAKKTS